MNKYRSKARGKRSKRYFSKTAARVNGKNVRRQGCNRGGYRL